MPDERIDIQCDLRRRTILKTDGSADERLVPDLEDDRLLALFRAMLLARRFDERLLQLQRSGRIGTFAPVKGQEAAQIGAAAALDEGDWIVPAFRETAAAVWHGASLANVLLYNAGYNEGACVQENARMLPNAVPVASQLPHAVGIAYAAKLLEANEVVLAFFGDGATSEGDFHEALNFAGVFDLPVVFLCQNNGWAISMPRRRQTRSRTLAQKALAYGLPGMVVDGNDVLAVYSATAEAVARARRGDGPTLIEAETYRLEVHTTADDPTRYRSDAEVKHWRERDPLDRMRLFLGRRGLLDDEVLERLEMDIERRIGAAWEEADRRMAQLEGPLVMFDHVFADRPAYLERERQEASSRLVTAEEQADG